MALSFKPLEDQVVVITGASHGLGLTTAKMAVQCGAKVFLISRNEENLRHFCDEVRSRNGRAEYFVADVVDEKAIQQAAKRCADSFGRIDTWVNTASAALHGKILNTDDKEAHRVFDTNFWGVVYGSKAAVPFLRERGGVIINLGSVASDVSFPFQGYYSASKFAIRSFTHALRGELERDGLPIAVTLVKPGLVDIADTVQAARMLGDQSGSISSVQNSQKVAEAILSCAENPSHEVSIGAPVKTLTVLERLFPRLHNFLVARYLMMERQQWRAQRRAGIVPKPLMGSPVEEVSRSRQQGLKGAVGLGVVGLVSLFVINRRRRESILRAREEGISRAA